MITCTPDNITCIFIALATVSTLFSLVLIACAVHHWLHRK